MTLSKKAAATTGAVFPIMGIANRNFEYRSMAVRQKVSLFRPAGRGPNRSIQMSSPMNPLVLMNLLEGLTGKAWNRF